MNFEEVQEFAQQRIDYDKENGIFKMKQKMFERFHLIWEYPGTRPDGIRKEVSSDPRDDILDAVDLHPLDPKLNVKPSGSNPETKENAQRVEDVISWNLKKALNRTGNIKTDIVRDGYLYDEIALQVLYLKNQFEVLEISEERRRHALMDGPFVILRRDPREVFAVSSDYGLEAVLHRTIMPLKEFKLFWNAEELEAENSEDYTFVTVFDYWSLDQRMVWAVLQGDQTAYAEPTAAGTKIVDEKNDLGFLPWSVRGGGKDLNPLLGTDYKAKVWETKNILETFASSETLAYMAGPRYVKTGIGEVDIKFGEVGTIAEVDDPNTEFEPLAPVPIDPALLTLLQRLENKSSKSSIPKAISEADFVNQPFASTVEQIRLGTKRLNRGKTWVEEVYEDACKIIIYWIDKTGDPLFASMDVEGGTEFVSINENPLEPEFNVNNLMFEIEMSADLPEDEVAKMNVARMGLEAGLSEKTVLGRVVEDPVREIAERRESEVAEATHQARLTLIDGKAQAEVQAMIMQAQIAVEQEAAAPAENPDASFAESLRGPGQVEATRNRGVGNEALRGEGFNPALGGTPPDLGNPGTSSAPIQEGRNAPS